MIEVPTQPQIGDKKFATKGGMLPWIPSKREGILWKLKDEWLYETERTQVDPVIAAQFEDYKKWVEQRYVMPGGVGSIVYHILRRKHPLYGQEEQIARTYGRSGFNSKILGIEDPRLNFHDTIDIATALGTTPDNLTRLAQREEGNPDETFIWARCGAFLLRIPTFNLGSTMCVGETFWLSEQEGETLEEVLRVFEAGANYQAGLDRDTLNGALGILPFKLM